MKPCSAELGMVEESRSVSSAGQGCTSPRSWVRPPLAVGLPWGQREPLSANHTALMFWVCSPQARVQHYSISSFPFIGLENDSLWYLKQFATTAPCLSFPSSEDKKYSNLLVQGGMTLVNIYDTLWYECKAVLLLGSSKDDHQTYTLGKTTSTQPQAVPKAKLGFGLAERRRNPHTERW